MTKVINLYGGPGTGKSTTAAHTFALLKQAGVNAELVTEYAKDKVWENSFGVLANQVYVLGKQYHKMFRLIGKADVIVTDSPLLFSLYYGKSLNRPFKDLVVSLYKSMDNIDIFLNRVKVYNPVGRMQTEEQAKDIDLQLKQLLGAYSVSCIAIDADANAAKKILELVSS